MITISETNDLKEAESLWRALSPRQTIFDEWDFRYCFYKYAPLPLCFLAAYENKELIGLLPLQRHPKHGYEFFAEDPCEENRPFIKIGYEKIIPDLYAAIPGPAKCFDISGDDEFTTKLPLEDYKYLLPLPGLNNFEDFLKTRLSSKRRRSLSKELAEIAAADFKIEFSETSERLLALESLFKLNHDNFTDESYLKENERAPWRDLLRLPYDWKIAVIKFQDDKQAVSLSILFNGEWHYLITGANYKKFPGLGKFLVKINIEAALLAKALLFDAGLGDCGWKHLWHFDRKPQYELSKAENGKIELAK